ncbi:MAG: HEAT repeat domain-containing protein, partial [Candidatus Angelobacter sp.]
FASSDQDLRLTAAAALLKMNDIQVLGAAIREASQLPLDSYLRLNLASAIRDGIRSEGAIPEIATMLKSKDPRMRRAAASALHNIGTVACLPLLVIALRDEDKDTRYYAVIGLAEIEGEPDKKPSMEDFDRNPSPYVSYWQAWANGHEK